MKKKNQMGKRAAPTMEAMRRPEPRTVQPKYASGRDEYILLRFSSKSLTALSEVTIIKVFVPRMREKTGLSGCQT